MRRYCLFVLSIGLFFSAPVLSYPNDEVVDNHELLFELGFLNRFMSLANMVDGAATLHDIITCSSQSCVVTSVAATALQVLGRKNMQRMIERTRHRPGAPIFNDQIDRAAFLQFLSQLRTFADLAKTEPDSVEVGLVFDSFRSISRQLQGFDDASWGNVFSRFLKRALVSASKDPDLLKRTLEELRAPGLLEQIPLKERYELELTSRQLEALIPLKSFRPGTASYVLLFGTTLGQYYFYVPMIIPHTIYSWLGKTQIGKKLAYGSAVVCHGYVCAVNYPVQLLMQPAEAVDSFFADFHDRLESDWQKRQVRWNAIMANQSPLQCSTILAQ